MLTVVEVLNDLLKPYHVEIRFSKKAVEDLSVYKTEQKEKILAPIIARTKRGTD